MVAILKAGNTYDLKHNESMSSLVLLLGLHYVLMRKIKNRAMAY